MPTVLVALLPNENGHKVEVIKEKILFDELQRQGHLLPHGCLSGSCGACRIEILEGADKLSAMGAVEADTVESIRKNYCETNRQDLVLNKNIRLACRARVLGDIKITILY